MHLLGHGGAGGFGGLKALALRRWRFGNESGQMEASSFGKTPSRHGDRRDPDLHEPRKPARVEGVRDTVPNRVARSSMTNVNEDKLRSLGLRRTQQEGLPRRGQWYLGRNGQPYLAVKDPPAGDVSGADVFEFLEPDGETAMIVTARCLSCGKTEAYRFVGWDPTERTVELNCHACSQRSR
jgi:hypothetical protein